MSSNKTDQRKRDSNSEAITWKTDLHSGHCFFYLIWSLFMLIIMIVLLNLRDFLQITFEGYSSWSLGHSLGGLTWGLVGGPVVGEA